MIFSPRRIPGIRQGWFGVHAPVVEVKKGVWVIDQYFLRQIETVRAKPVTEEDAERARTDPAGWLAEQAGLSGQIEVKGHLLERLLVTHGDGEAVLVAGMEAVQATVPEIFPYNREDRNRKKGKR